MQQGMRRRQEREIRLVATDLDGTLLRADRTISGRTRETLARVAASGVQIVLVTGRPPRFVDALARELDLTGAAICANGAICYDLANRSLLEHHPLPAPDAARIVRTLLGAIPEVTFAVERGLSYGCEPNYLAIGQHTQPQDELVADALTLCAEPVTKLIARHPIYPAEQLYALAASVVGEQAHVTFSGPHIIEISSPGVNKAAALERLCARLGVARSEVVAFGDMPNDATMLEWAGLGVAVANAHPEALNAADTVTLTNMEDGVAHMIDQLLPSRPDGRRGHA